MNAWKFKVKLGRPYEEGRDVFSEHRDRVVGVIRGSWWFRDSQYSTDLADAAERLADARTIEDFDDEMDLVYDLADADRCWLESSPW